MARQRSKKRGIIYVLSNKEHPDILKIGRVESVQLPRVRKRIRGLQSGSPYPYFIECAALADDVKTAEDDVHDIHDGNRMKEKGGGTEWFKISPKAAEKTLERLKGLSLVTNEQLAELRGEPTKPPKREPKEKTPKRASSTKSTGRPRFTFDSIGVPMGATLIHVSDQRITTRVVSLNPPRIQFNGQRMTLSAAAKLLMPEKRYSIDGPLHWKYNGRTIRAISEGK